MALRTRIDRPPTWESGSAHSQRSLGSTPSATAEPSALHRKLPYVSSTGRGAEVVPEVWITTHTASRSWVAPLANASEPDSAEPDSAEPDSAEPDSAEPDSAEPDFSKLGFSVTAPSEAGPPEAAPSPT